MKLLLSAFMLAVTVFRVSDALAVMSIDLGSEFLKIAIVKPGVPMEIVLNKESRRKTATMVSLRNDERLFSDGALNTGVKYPPKAYWYLTELLGKSIDHPVVKRFQERYPYYTLEAEPDTNLVLFKYDDETSYSVEELLAMILDHAKQNAEAFAEQPINEAVITVPPYFNQAERRAVLRASDLAGIKVLQLINDNTAVALNYGVFRRKEFNSTKTHYLFFDMGATSTTATVVEYVEVKDKNKVTGIVDKYPQVTVLGVGYDRTLGGSEFQIRLRDHLAKAFNEQKKTSLNVFENHRSMAKLYKEAGRVKQVLSANVDHFAQVEGLLDDQDFKAKVTREEFEKMNSDLFERITNVVQEVLKSSEITLEELSDVILMGGSTRIPKVQETLSKTVSRFELGKSINTDEAAALGAVYQAAELSKGFKVKKFNVKEANLFPVAVEFERVKQIEDAVAESKLIKRVLFGRNNPYPQNKVMTFNKHTNDFTFNVAYTDADFLSGKQLQELGERHLQSVTLAGVKDAYDKMPQEDTESKGVKAHFRMDESGILTLTKAEFVYEKKQTEEDEQEAETEQSTFSKLGDTISNFFGGSSKTEPEPSTGEEKKPSTEEEKKPDTEEKKPGTEGEKESENTKEAPTTGQDEQETEQEAKEPEKTTETPPKEEAEKTKETKEEKKTTEDTSKSTEANKTTETKEKAKDAKPKIVVVKDDLKVNSDAKDIADPNTERINSYRDRLKKLNERDAAILALAKAQNELEAFLVDANDKLYQDEYIKCSTEEERETISKELSAASDWLYDQDPTTPAKSYKDKLSDLKKVIVDLWERVKELEERPQAVAALNSMVNHSEFFLHSMKNYTSEEPGEKPFTTIEYTTLEKLINSTKEWNETVQLEQSKTPLTEKPKFTIIDVAQKIHELEREVKYLVNKAKTFKPKKKEEEKKKETAAKNDTKGNDTKTETESKDEKSKDKKPSNDTEKVEPVPEGGFDTTQFEKDLEADHEEQEQKKSETKKSEEESTKDAEGEEPLMLDGDSEEVGEQSETPTTTEQTETKHTHSPEDL